MSASVQHQEKWGAFNALGRRHDLSGRVRMRVKLAEANGRVDAD